MSTALAVALVGGSVALIVALFGLQTYWIARSIDKVQDELRAFKTENHADMQAHTEAIATLRERVTRLEA